MMFDSMWRDPGIPADSYYEVRAECTDVPKTRFKIKAGKTLSERRWRSGFSPEGYLDISKMLNRIQRGGIHPTIRGEVWEFLLGCYDPKSTYEEREQIRLRRREQYAMWKEVCKNLDPVVGSGRIITAPLITEDGVPIQDPLNLLEANQGKGPNQDKRPEANQDKVPEANQEKEPEANQDEGPETDQDEGPEANQDKGPEANEDKGPEANQDKGPDTSIPEDGQNAENSTELSNSASSNSSGSEQTESTNHPPLEKRVIQWKLTLHQIGLDVVRTDRTLVFYEKQENLSKLWDILAVYAWMDKDVGYCQGMSDLCSPMIILLEDEADGFWCFERLMRRLRGNFRCTESSVGVETQLSNLAAITQVLDPKLHQHLEALGGGDYLFAFRMLMVLFRREFSFGDALYLWEMMWALEYDPDLFSLYEEPDLIEGSKGKAKQIRQCGKYERENMRNAAKSADAPLPISVFLVASVLKAKSSKLMTEARGLDDVVKILNDITGDLDAKKACTGAMKLHKKYLKKAKKP